MSPSDASATGSPTIGEPSAEPSYAQRPARGELTPAPGESHWDDGQSSSDGDSGREALRSDWVPLRTLVMTRWIAIVGQVASIAVAHFALRIDVALGGVALAVGASILVNLFATALAPRGRRLSEGEAAALMTFDILQLGALLALTGGLNNPFAVLMLAPVTIAATVLRLRAALFLGLLGLAVVTVLGPWHLPLHGPRGALELPPVFLAGFWLALATGMVFLGLYARRLATERDAMAEALAATQMALAREQRLTDLGGVVAAAAHELGTPLATIKLVSSELFDELAENPDLREDARLIREQADRCRDILRAMGRSQAGAGRGDRYLDHVPFEALVREAAEPHMHRGREVAILLANPSAANPYADEPGTKPGVTTTAPFDSTRQPLVARRPEIVHGLRNLVQNAVDFAEAQVTIRLEWSEDGLGLRIADDGPGFAPADLVRIGEPFMRRRTADATDRRPGYEGMGLGLFIAKTLLERTGARLTFANAPGGGAVVGVTWPPGAITPQRLLGATRLGR